MQKVRAMVLQPEVEHQYVNPSAFGISALEPQSPNAFPLFTLVHGLGGSSVSARFCNASHILRSSGKSVGGVFVFRTQLRTSRTVTLPAPRSGRSSVATCIARSGVMNSSSGSLWYSPCAAFTRRSCRPNGWRPIKGSRPKWKWSKVILAKIAAVCFLTHSLVRIVAPCSHP